MIFWNISISIPLLLLIIYYAMIFFSKKLKTIKPLSILYWSINITYIFAIISSIGLNVSSKLIVDDFIHIIPLIHIIPIARYMYLYGKSNIERRNKK